MHAQPWKSRASAPRNRPRIKAGFSLPHGEGDFERNRDFATTIKPDDNSNMTEPGADPPETLAEAAERFKKFLSAQCWPETIRWLTHDDVLVDRKGRFWIRERGMMAFEHAQLQYYKGVERNLGVALSAVCATDTETFASVFVPADDLR
jgi:hypothetical protein